MELNKQPIPYITAIICSICVIVYLIVPFESAMFIPAVLFKDPLSWYSIKSLLLASFIHTNLNHLMGNLMLISFIGYALERIIGSKHMLRVILWSMLGSLILFVGYNIESQIGGGGASGIAFGIIAAYALKA